MNSDHYQLSDESFITQFQSAALDPSLFNHEAHLRIAWLFVQRHRKAEAVELIAKTLKSYVASLGVSHKYHETLTKAAVEAVAHFDRKSEYHSFKEFIDANPQLMTNFKNLINSHYSFDVFESEEARKKYVGPDIEPFED